MTEKRKIAVIIGSMSDLNQCATGLEYLVEMKKAGKILFYYVDVSSQHRHTLNTQRILNEYADMDWQHRPDALIIGAGWANHLSGCSDAFLRYVRKNKTIRIFAVAVEDIDNPKHTEAAKLSISEVPGNKMISQDENGKQFVGANGFLNACRMAVKEKLPKIALKAPPEYKRMFLQEAYELSIKK